MSARRFLCAGAIALLAACGNDPAKLPPVSSASVTLPLSPAPPVATAAPSSATISNPAPACPHDGQWALCSIEIRLRQAGFVVTRLSESPKQRSGFSVGPTVYSLGKSRLEVFLYADSMALGRDLMKLDTMTASIRGTSSQWGELPPVFLRSANLAAVVLTQSQRQAERVVLALTAGAPQRGSPR